MEKVLITIIQKRASSWWRQAAENQRGAHDGAGGGDEEGTGEDGSGRGRKEDRCYSKTPVQPTHV